MTEDVKSITVECMCGCHNLTRVNFLGSAVAVISPDQIRLRIALWRWLTRLVLWLTGYRKGNPTALLVWLETMDGDRYECDPPAPLALHGNAEIGTPSGTQWRWVGRGMIDAIHS